MIKIWKNLKSLTWHPLEWPYYSFTFLGHGRQSTLNHFVGMKRDLKPECLYQISIDDPTVTLKFFQEFLANSIMKIIGSCSFLCMQFFETVLKNLNGPWRNFWMVDKWFSTTPQQEEKIMKASQDLQPILAVFCLTQYIWIIWIITAIFQKCIIICF